MLVYGEKAAYTTASRKGGKYILNLEMRTLECVVTLEAWLAVLNIREPQFNHNGNRELSVWMTRMQ